MGLGRTHRSGPSYDFGFIPCQGSRTASDHIQRTKAVTAMAKVRAVRRKSLLGNAFHVP
jgi:hypothetical protein